MDKFLHNLRLLFVLTVLALASCRSAEPEPIAAPEILSLDVSELSYDSAVLSAAVSGGSNIDKCGFLLSPPDGRTFQIPGILSGTDTFTARLDNLESESHYRFQAYVENGLNYRITSSEKEFTTAAAPVVPIPELLFVTASEITATGARLIAAVSYDLPISKVGFIVHSPGTGKTITILSELEGHGFTCALSDLDKSSTYRFKAFVESESGIRVESEEQSFSTPDEEDPVRFVSLKAIEISREGAILIASLNYGEAPLSVGFLLRAAEDNDEFALTTALDAENSIFIREVKGLKAGTRYYFQAFADCAGSGRIVSDSKYFDTLPSEPDPEPEPEPQFVRIPDEHFRNWILWRYDTDKDGKLSPEEAAPIETVELNTDETTSLDGIQLFPSLKKLHAEGTRVNDSGLGLLKSVDVSGNPELRILYVPHNTIDTLNLRNAVKLENIQCPVNKLRNIDLSMQKRAYLVNVSHNQLKTLDLSGLPLLVEVHCESQPLETITLDNPELVYLDCSNTRIRTLNLTKCPKANTVDCSDCPYLTTIYLVKGQSLGVLRRPETAQIVYL